MVEKKIQVYIYTFHLTLSLQPNLLHLAYNKDPAGIQFEQSEMRIHYDRCVDSGIISAFPQSKRPEKISQKSLKMNRK